LWLLQLLCGRFEDFLRQVEVGGERLEACLKLAERLMESRHAHSSRIRRTHTQLR